MDLGLAGRVAVVGGGNRGLGRAAAEALAREGASLALYARDLASLTAAAEELSSAYGVAVVPIAAEVSSAAACEHVVESAARELGGVDVLVTNMGGPPYGTALERSDDEWHRAWELVTLAVVRLCRAAVPHLRARGGSIVNITTCGVHQLIPGTALSAVSRLATSGFAKYLATELAADGIRVNNVLPGWIETQRVVDLAEAEARERGIPVPTVYDEQAAAVPMRRFGTPAEVADAVAFLASSRASYITGTNVRVDGGWCLDPIG